MSRRILIADDEVDLLEPVAYALRHHGFDVTTVLDGDTAETLHARIQIAERETYPRALRLVTEGKVRVQGRRCSVIA